MTHGVDPRLARGLQELFGLAAEDLALQADLAEDLFLDSLAVVELGVWLDDVTGADVPSVGAGPPPRTLGDLQALLQAPDRLPEDLTR